MHVCVCMIVPKRKLMFCNHSVIINLIPLHYIIIWCLHVDCVLLIHIIYELYDNTADEYT